MRKELPTVTYNSHLQPIQYVSPWNALLHRVIDSSASSDLALSCEFLASVFFDEKATEHQFILTNSLMWEVVYDISDLFENNVEKSLNKCVDFSQELSSDAQTIFAVGVMSQICRSGWESRYQKQTKQWLKQRREQGEVSEQLLDCIEAGIEGRIMKYRVTWNPYSIPLTDWQSKDEIISKPLLDETIPDKVKEGYLGLYLAYACGALNCPGFADQAFQLMDRCELDLGHPPVGISRYEMHLKANKFAVSDATAKTHAKRIIDWTDRVGQSGEYFPESLPSNNDFCETVKLLLIAGELEAARAFIQKHGPSRRAGDFDVIFPVIAAGEFEIASQLIPDNLNETISWRQGPVTVGLIEQLPAFLEYLEDPVQQLYVASQFAYLRDHSPQLRKNQPLALDLVRQNLHLLEHADKLPTEALIKVMAGFASYHQLIDELTPYIEKHCSEIDPLTYIQKYRNSDAGAEGLRLPMELLHAAKLSIVYRRGDWEAADRCIEQIWEVGNSSEVEYYADNLFWLVGGYLSRFVYEDLISDDEVRQLEAAQFWKRTVQGSLNQSVLDVWSEQKCVYSYALLMGRAAGQPINVGEWRQSLGATEEADKLKEIIDQGSLKTYSMLFP
ncbi:MAG: hypothetical protein AAF226_12870, partial [Verrucomicrobiota bacterium]